MKKCSKCKIEKDLTEFSKKQSYCKLCTREYYKEYSLNNKDKINEKSKRYSLNNKRCSLVDKVKSREKFKRYYLKNKEKYNADKRVYIKNRRETNPLFKLSSNIRTSIRKSIKKCGYTKKSKTYEILGCDFETFKNHIEKQFTKGMSWDNQGKWHFDHIYPVSLARDEKHLIELNHYTNFQPLWAEDNLSKSDKVIEKQLFLL